MKTGENGQTKFNLFSISLFVGLLACGAYFFSPQVSVLVEHVFGGSCSEEFFDEGFLSLALKDNFLPVVELSADDQFEEGPACYAYLGDAVVRNEVLGLEGNYP